MPTDMLSLSAIPHGRIRRMARATGLVPALSLNDPVGPPRLMVAFPTNDHFALIVGGVLWAASTVMREAARLAEGNARFV